MSESVCSHCDSPLPIGLAMLASCRHVGHAKCITKYVRFHGRCWVNTCAMPAVESEVLSLHIDPPQPNWIGVKDQQSVREVIGVIRQRLVGHPQYSNTSDNDFEQVASIFDNLTSPDRKVNTQDEVQSANEWPKLLDLIRKSSPFIAVVVFALLCWYFAPMVLWAGGALFESVSSLVMGLGACLRNFFPEIVASGLAFFTTYTLGKKKLAD